jgi:hypothetical protein
MIQEIKNIVLKLSERIIIIIIIRLPRSAEGP